MMQAEDEAALIEWLLCQGRDTDDLGALFAGSCTRLLAHGVPLWRASLSIPTIDPTTRALSFVWWRDRALSTERVASDAASAMLFQRSPIFHLRQNNRITGRWNLADAEVARELPLLEELRQLGGTEYAMRLVTFSERRTALEGVALAVATDRAGGFADADMETIARMLPAVAMVAYRIGLLQVATETLGAYLGPQTGGHVLQGMVRRGDSQTLPVAILLADLRGFTALADRAEGAAVVGWLNEHLEAIGDPVAECGGEVLKFLGDGLLAVFSADADPAKACAAALAAAAAALDATAALNARRAAAGGPELDVSVVLHFGDVVYGNIGTARRLDFTVIGLAVNEASRMEALGKSLGRPLLLSESFARRCGRACASLGRHTLRGIAAEREVFVLDT